MVIVGLALLAGVAYVVSLHRHPYVTCRSCGGSGRHHGWMFPRAYRACGRCGGSPRRRLGTVLFGIAPPSGAGGARRRLSGSRR